MPVNGTISIYRVTATPATDTETEVSDKVEFNGDAAVPDTLSKIQSIKPIMTIIGQENETPDSNNPSLLDETGLAFVGLEISGYFKGNESSRPKAPRTFRNWMKADKKNSDFPFGRFGFRNSIDNEFDLVPSAIAGYILEHFEYESNYRNRDYQFFAKLRFQGDIAQLNSA